VKHARHIGFILAAMLLVNFFAAAAAVAQQDDATALDKRVGELLQAGKFSEAIPLAQQSLAIREKALGPRHRDIAISLNELALLYDKQGRYTDAEPLYKRSLAIREEALGPDHSDVAESLNNLGLLYLEQGRYADTEPFLRRSLAIREKALGPNHPDVAISLNNLGLLYLQQGRYADAEPLLRRALAIREEALGSDHPDVARVLDGLAKLYHRLGRFTDAAPLFGRSLAIREKALGPDHPDVAISLNDLADLYSDQGRFADAEPLLRRSLAIREKALGLDHPAVATALNSLGWVHFQQGHSDDAEPFFRRALAIREKALGPDHPDVATTLRSLGWLCLQQGRLADAEALYKRATAILEKALGYNHPAVATSLNDLALVYGNEGRYADAEPLLRRALAIHEKALGPDHPEVAPQLNNLALFYFRQGRYADAEPLYRRALTIHEKARGPDHPRFANTLNNLAVLYTREGRYADAEPLLKRSLAIREKVFGHDHITVATSLTSLADLYAAQRRYTDAEPLYRQALAISEKALGPYDPNVALNNLAVLYANQDRYADALPLVQTAIRRGRAAPSFALPVLFAAQGRGLVAAGTAQDDALNVVQRASQSAAAAAVNRLGARLAAGSGRLAGLVRTDQDLAAEAEKLDKAILAAVSNEIAKRDAAAEQRIRDHLAEIAKQRTTLQGVLAAEFPDYAALTYPQPLAVKEIRGLLSDGEALLLFATGEKESYVFAVTRQDATWKSIPLGTAALSSKVAAFRRGLDVEALRQSAEGGKPVLFDLGLANDLYAALIGPVEEVVRDARHLLVVPSGPLTSLPFHLLVTEKPATPIPQLKDIGSYRNAAWLIKRQAVSVLPALSSLKALRQVARRDPGARPLVGFGDPIFDPAERAKALAERRARTRVAVTRGYGDFWQGASIDRGKLAQYLPPLLDTADELKAVARKLGAAAGDVHLGSDASETTVKRTPLADYRVVYFATHGLVAGDIAGLGEPSLALTIPREPTELDDGLLTASEVAQLKLNADWVVLSACNTAAADKPGAQALSGLARAFFYAGARALLVSHWSVDSEAATRLTTSTFALMKADPKLGRAQALRDAMLAYMNDKGSLLNAYPAFWGPFSIIGEGAESATPAVGSASQQPEQTCTAQMPSSQMPDVPQHVEARVTDTVPTAEVLTITRNVELQTGAKESPAYLGWYRVWAQNSASGHRTIAAIPPDMTVKLGDLVELNSRYRDRSLPCHFVPWTINRVIEHAP
jgi:tetratricopeptide (TPR) repeat protein